MGKESLEEDKAVSGCTLVSGTWKKCGGCRRMEDLPCWEFPLNPGQIQSHRN